MKFVHVPKTGGTSIIHALKLDNKGHYTLDKYTPNTFTVVRNPFDRLVSHFFYTFSQSLGANIHLSVSGDDDHHKIEACFKALGRALSQALNISENKELPSTKGTL